MNPIGQVIDGVLWAFIALLFVRFVVDWIQVFARSWTPRGLVLVGLEAVYTVTDPPIKAMRKILPPLRLGGMALDLSFLAVMLICYVLLAVNRAIWLS
ncbi:MAG TPA: YggT family protein [Marmoricola sp.]|jgi:YggT family protein|nr:YggT family protein [Marmoricola sp.]